MKSYTHGHQRPHQLQVRLLGSHQISEEKIPTVHAVEIYSWSNCHWEWIRMDEDVWGIYQNCSEPPLSYLENENFSPSSAVYCRDKRDKNVGRTLTRRTLSPCFFKNKKDSTMFKFDAVYFMALGLHRVELTPAEFFGLSIFFFAMVWRKKHSMWVICAYMIKKQTYRGVSSSSATFKLDNPV